MLNNDCLSNVFRFVDSKTAIQVNRQFAVERFPQKIKVKNAKQYRAFMLWCETFDTRNLEEVRQIFSDIWWKHANDFTVGWVPPSVHTLCLDDYDSNLLWFSPTIRELTIGKCLNRDIIIPPSVRKLTLGSKFDGIVTEFPEALEELIIKNWDWDRHYPQRLELPDSIRTMTLVTNTPVQVDHWPEQLETLTLETDDEDYVYWLGIEHAPIPEWVNVIRIGNPRPAIVYPEPEMLYDDYDTPNDW